MTRIRNPLIILGEMRGYLLGVGLVLCIVATAVVFLPQPQKANAFHLNPPGRAERVGYFTGKSITGLNNGLLNRVIENGGKGLTNVIDRASFITIMRNDLNSSDPNDSTGAAFIVLDMLGYLAGPGSTIAQAKAVFEKDWVAAINNAASIDFANNGLTNFNYNINTFWVLKNAEPTGDVGWYSESPAKSAPSIIINWGSTDPNSSGYLGRYAIKKSCGNPVGDGTIRSAPNVLTAVHVDDDQAGAAMWWMNDVLWNRIACISPFITGGCTSPANITDRQGYYYSIKLTDGNYSVTNNSTPSGYDYVSFDYNGTSYSKDFPAGITVNYMNRNPKITWHYKKKPTQTCSPVASPVGINESTTFNSSAQTGNSWSAGFANLPNTGTGVSFTVSYSQIGNFPVELRVNSGTAVTCWVVVTQRPYIRAYGGDIFAGSSSCDIVGWKNNGGNAGIYGFGSTAGKGSGAQLGVLAMGQIWDFNSAMLRTGSAAPQPPNGLTFGNESPPLGKIGISECPPDYWGKKTRTINNVLDRGLGTIDLANYPSGEYYADSARGTVVINAVDIPIGRVVNLYVEGNLLILGNITYAGSGSWGSVSEIPRLQIVAKGNISIGKSVTQLDGVYVAQGKTIYTCSNFTPANIRTECNTQLTVNGALVASRIKWLRTFGHWLESTSTASENPSLASMHSCTSLGVTSQKPTCASEIVNLGPEAWMVEQLTANPTADYIQALPPLL